MLIRAYYRLTTPITSRLGRNLSVPERRLREASTAIPIPRPSRQHEAFMIDSSPSSRCSLDTGRNMPIWSFRLRALKQQIWYVLKLLWPARATTVLLTLVVIMQVYERGVASISPSVDLWTNYCSFKAETSHDADVIRE